MIRISQDKACEALCLYKSTHVWVHKDKTDKNEDGTYKWLSPFKHTDTIDLFNFECLDKCEWRTATRISKGVRFNTGSELDIRGTKCYLDTVKRDSTGKWHSVLVVECSFCTIYYVLYNVFGELAS